MPVFPTYQLFGLRLRSEIDLAAPLWSTDGFDVDIHWDEPRVVPAEPPSGRRLFGLTGNGRIFHTAVEQDEGYLFRSHDVCEVHISHELRTVAVSPHPDGELGMVPILLAGNIVALLLTLSGAEVLHGSVVEVAGSGVAFIGHSGAGKSTLAGEACAAGARFVADDLLVVDLDGPGATCRRGGSELRLRPGSAELARRLSSNRTTTYDQRTAVAFNPVQTERLPLSAIVLPQVQPGLEAPRVDRLVAGAAFRALTPYHRLAGLTDAAAVRHHFHACVELARRVPVLTLAVPPGASAQGAALVMDRALVERAAS